MTKFIVAEVSKNWFNGEESLPDSGLLSEKFEMVIEYNRKRGYKLHSFQLHRLIFDHQQGDVAGNEMNESIIAVFEMM